MSEQEKTGLTNEVLNEAMGKVHPPIKSAKVDKTDVLIKKIVESMRTRKVVASSEGDVLMGAVAEQRPADGAAVVHVGVQEAGSLAGSRGKEVEVAGGEPEGAAGAEEVTLPPLSRPPSPFPTSLSLSPHTRTHTLSLALRV